MRFLCLTGLALATVACVDVPHTNVSEEKPAGVVLGGSSTLTEDEDRLAHVLKCQGGLPLFRSVEGNKVLGFCPDRPRLARLTVVCAGAPKLVKVSGERLFVACPDEASAATP